MSNDTKPICPICGGFIPNDAQPGAYPGALSRVDNRTEICSACGVDEAMQALAPLRVAARGRVHPHLND